MCYTRPRKPRLVIGVRLCIGRRPAVDFAQFKKAALKQRLDDQYLALWLTYEFASRIDCRRIVSESNDLENAANLMI
jgi:hypothetical protein